MRKGFLIVIVIFAAVIRLAAQLPPDDWQQFRSRHPHHLQVIAVSAADSSGSRTLVITEPPPGVTLASLAAADSLLKTPEVRTWRIGMDGWVKDLVYRLPPLPDGRLTGLVDRISAALFSTAYKSYVVRMDAPAGATAARMNLQVSAAQLRGWLTDGGEVFGQLGRTERATLPVLLGANRTGIFYSGRTGLVVWILPRTLDLASRAAEVRQFTLDTDLIIGALPGLTHVAIVGRERQIDLRQLPPLRTETVRLLASIGDDELAQSYERTNFAAGKLQSDDDWAPIFLSDALIDTGTGSLLNITDQLLKSWTSVGRVKYRGFTYPDPETWPFDRPLSEILEASRLTFNWNTRGVGYELAARSGRTFALERTGALPVTYIPEGASPAQQDQVRTSEDKAYRYFANSGDPNLVRVVQYAALYQIFRLYGTGESITPAPTRPHPEMAALAGPVAVALRQLQRATDDDLRQRLVALGVKPQHLSELVEDLKEVRLELQAYGLTASDPNLTGLAGMLAGSRATRSNLSPAAFEAMLDAMDAVRPFRAVLIDTDAMLSVFRTAGARAPGSWIKTPCPCGVQIVGSGADHRRSQPVRPSHPFPIEPRGPARPGADPYKRAEGTRRPRPSR